ncbi:MAG TPA: ACT domain-containing protein [Candidatus Binatia bacterium]|jgi:glycine cleavage system transcriptional repressor
MDDKSHLILTAVGPDQVGLVEKLSEFISRRGCNIEDSKMAVFCGEFAVIVLITGAPGDLAKVTAAAHELESETGLKFSVKRPAERRAGESLRPYKLVASCMDHPGIVYSLSRELSRLGINIESMETKAYAAPVSGTPMFRLEAAVSVPAKTNVNALRDRFSEIQREENIDIEFAPSRP